MQGIAPARDEAAAAIASSSSPPVLIRPRAVKATSSSIAARVWVPPLTTISNFPSACANEGIPESAIFHAAQHANEWNRRWIEQAEDGHDDLALDWADMMDDLRRGGAQNPSLSSSTTSEENQEAPIRRPMAVRPPPPLSSPEQQYHHQEHCVYENNDYWKSAPDEREEHPDVGNYCVPPQYLTSERQYPSSPLTVPSSNDEETTLGAGGDGGIVHAPMALEDMSFHMFANSLEEGRLDDDEEGFAFFPGSSKIPIYIDSSSSSPEHYCSELDLAKDDLLHALAISGGDVDTPAFQQALAPLARHYAETGWDACDSDGIYSNYDGARRLEGMWLTLSKASYFGQLGTTPDGGDPMYTLGRMSFDMFRPTQLICSLQGNFNPVRVVDSEERASLMEQCPTSLREEIANGTSVLRKYDIVTAFTIEPHLVDYPNAPNKTVRRPIKGIMTTYGYVLPDPSIPNRLSIFFTGGRMEANNDATDQKEWNRLFCNSNQPLPKHNLGEKLRLLAASLLLGAKPPESVQEDGSMEFQFTRPLGGHGVAYVDVIYMDDNLRIVRGHRGTTFAFLRVSDK